MTDGMANTIAQEVYGHMLCLGLEHQHLTAVACTKVEPDALVQAFAEEASGLKQQLEQQGRQVSRLQQQLQDSAGSLTDHRKAADLGNAQNMTSQHLEAVVFRVQLSATVDL